ncbi:MAG TPA: hypothetical protein VES19_03630 [Candidatus Limnocylindrales bacterium]|nr:hypothetical protein [Candidatus Limnocylindrales bacterium]
MAEPMNGPITHCPWCSAHLPDPGIDHCPSCGAALIAVADAPSEIKGVTTLDTEAILRARAEVARPQRNNRLLSFITGEMPVDTSTPAGPEVFAPPPDEVRREMLRLQLEAERAELAAETVALKADELTRRGIHLSELGGVDPAHDPGPAPDPGLDPVAANDSEPVPEGGWPAALTPDDAEPESQG